MSYDEKTLARFWSKVRKTRGCWLWTGYVGSHGYGVFASKRHSLRAHRVAFRLATGEKLDSSTYVLHSCDVKTCVNPSHLRTGTHAENMRDMVSRGRQARGERQHAASLTPRDVLSIRSSRKGGAILESLAEEHDVTVSTISRICRGETWSHIRGPLIHGKRHARIEGDV